jgi:hypothetical protein
MTKVFSFAWYRTETSGQIDRKLHMDESIDGQVWQFICVYFAYGS